VSYATYGRQVRFGGGTEAGLITVKVWVDPARLNSALIKEMRSAFARAAGLLEQQLLVARAEEAPDAR
jgi:hypothetical protein